MILILISIVLFIGCNEQITKTSKPIINLFIAQPNQIEEGGYSALIWNVTNAEKVTLDNGIGNVELKGSRVVLPTNTTVYKLRATNSAGRIYAFVQIVVGFWEKPVIGPSVLVKAVNSSKCIIITLTMGGLNYSEDGYSFANSVTIWLNGTILDETNLSNNTGWEIGENLYIGGSTPTLEDEWLYVEKLGSGYYLLTIRVNGIIIYDDEIAIE